MVDDKFLTVQQAAEVLQIDAGTLRVLTRKGRVPAFKLGRQWRFDPGLLREWAREQSLRGQSGTRQKARPAGRQCKAESRGR
jgi:excisionase family DNA binding protein